MTRSAIDLIVDENIKTMREIPQKQWEIVLNIGNARITSKMVSSKDVTENYMNDAFSSIMVTAVFKPSELTNYIMPGANRLEATLICKDIYGKVRNTYKYRAILANNSDPKLANNDNRSSDIRELDRITMVPVTLQLIDHATFDLRIAQTGEVFNDTIPIEALISLLSEHKLVDDYGLENAVAGFDITEGYHKNPKTIVVRDGTYIRSLARNIHNSVGIYNQGCACFMKERVWYIFPPYGVCSEGELTKNHRLVIINAPPNRHSSTKRNFRQDGTTTTIIASGHTEHINNSDADSLNGATGTMYGKSSKLLGGTSNVDKGVVSGVENYLVEYDTGNYNAKERNIVVPNEAFISNESYMSSLLAAKAGDIVDIVWEHGDINKLKPGAAVTFITQDEKRIRTLYGTLVAAQSLSSIPEKGVVETIHQENVSMKLFLKRPSKK